MRAGLPRLRAAQRVFLSYLLLIALVVLSFSVVVHTVLRRQLIALAEHDLRRELVLGRQIFDTSTLPPDSLADLLGSLSGRRVTVIAPDGIVTGDSRVARERLAELENHAARPEVRQALGGMRGRDLRTSRSLETGFLYLAIPTDRGDILRFAVPLDDVDATLARVQRGVFGIGGTATLLAALLALGISFALTRPLRRMSDVARGMARGDLSRRLPVPREDELGELADALNTLAGELQHRLGELEEERTETRAIFDSMTEGVLALSADGTVRRTNPAARRMFLLRDASGVQPEAVARRPEFLRLVERALGGEHVLPTEMPYSGRHLLAAAHPLPDGGAVFIFLDITERRRLESVRRDFVANASHELKTPLTAIRGYSETLLDPELPPELRLRFAETVRANADRLRQIIDDLLDLSRIESGGWRVQPEPVAVAEVAREVWAACEGTAGEKNIELGLALAPGCEWAFADPAALRQIFANLFSNSLRYTPPGGTIELHAECFASADRSAISDGAERPTRSVPGTPRAGWLQVEIRDTGSGIASTHLPRIFERFYRADPARSRVEGGTGLGLAIVRHLVEAHGGCATAESELGLGTTIRFTLPAAPHRLIPLSTAASAHRNGRG